MNGGVVILILWLSIGGSGGGVATHEFIDWRACEQVGLAAMRKWGVHRVDFLCVHASKE